MNSLHSYDKLKVTSDMVRRGGNGVNGDTLTLSQMSHFSFIQNFLRSTGLHGISFDGNRDVYEILGYPRKITFSTYFETFRRGGIANRIVTTYPNATWSGNIIIQETPEPGNITPFETDIHGVLRQLNILSKVRVADILSCIGRYSVLFLGFNDVQSIAELGNEVSGTNNLLLHVSALDELHAKVDDADLIADVLDPNFGKPKFYHLNLGGINTSVKVHHTRIIHVSADPIEGDLLSRPCLEPVMNLLADLDKVTGGGAEAAWKTMKGGKAIGVPPDVEFDTQAQDKLEAMVTEYDMQLRNYIAARGLEIQDMSTPTVDFSPNAQAIISQIAATVAIPQRILMGAEAGQLASDQDRHNFADGVMTRKDTFGIRTVTDFVDRTIRYGVVATPKVYDVIFPTIDELDDVQKSTVILNMAKANKEQIDSGGEVITLGSEIRQRVLGLDALKDDQQVGEIDDNENDGNDDGLGATP